jgi:hypothetical protein
MHHPSFQLIIRRLGFCIAAAGWIALCGCGTTSGNAPLSPPTGPTGSSTTGVTSGPMLGYAWDTTAAGLRPIFGVPGAAQFGSLKYSGAGYNGAAVCAAKQFALLTGTNGQAWLASLPSGTPLEVANQLSAKEQIAMSPSCVAALLYAPGSSAATLISGLPGNPQAQAIELSASGSLTSAAVSDSGLVLAAFGQSSGGVAVESISSKGSASLVTTAGRFAGMTFLSATQNALIADAANNTVWLASNLTAGVSLEAAATSQQGISQPVAIAASSDGRWLVAAIKGGASVVRIDLTGQSPAAQVACSCTAKKLGTLSGNSTFLLSDITSGPVWTFDGDAASPRIVFIPGVRSATAAGVTQ